MSQGLAFKPAQSTMKALVNSWPKEKLVCLDLVAARLWANARKMRRHSFYCWNFKQQRTSSFYSKNKRSDASLCVCRSCIEFPRFFILVLTMGVVVVCGLFVLVSLPALSWKFWCLARACCGGSETSMANCSVYDSSGLEGAKKEGDMAPPGHQE